jgi:hypothetical protein
VSEPAFDPVRALETLARHEVRFVVVGAFAAVVQGYPLATYDLDVTPSRDRSNLEQIVLALRELNGRLRLPRNETMPFPLELKTIEQNDARTLATDAGPLDLVFMPAGTGGYDNLRRDAVEETVGGVPVLLASLRDIIRMKRASNRVKDEAQIPALRATLDRIRERAEP